MTRAPWVCRCSRRWQMASAQLREQREWCLRQAGATLTPPPSYGPPLHYRVPIPKTNLPQNDGMMGVQSVHVSESEYSNVVTQQPAVRVDAATACFPRIFVFPVKPSGSSDLSPSQKSIRGQTGYFHALHPLDSLQRLQRKSFSYSLLKCRLVAG